MESKMKMPYFFRWGHDQWLNTRLHSCAIATNSLSILLRAGLKGLLGIALTFSILATLPGVSVPAAAQAPVKVRVGDTASFAHLGLYVGMEKGIFRKHGIEIERVVMPGGSKVLTTLLSDDIDIGYLAAVTTLQAQFQSRPVKIIGASHIMEIYSLLGRNDFKGAITKPADLKNHTVGISAPGSGSWAFANLLALAGSLDPARDIKIVPIGGMMPLISALKSNSVDTVTLWEPGTTIALSEGVGYSILDLQDPIQHKQFMNSTESLVEVIAAKEDFIAGKRDALRKFFAAQNESYAWIHSAPVEEVARTVAPIVGQQNMEVLIKSLKRMIPGVPKTALVDEKIYTATMAKMVSAGLFKDAQPFAKAVDNTFGDTR
jgi:NitT/TauT family transport system substrate-binding protein